MPGDVAVQGPGARVVGDKADVEPAKGLDRRRVAPQWVRQVDRRGDVRRRIAVALGQDKVLVAVQMDRVVAIWEKQSVSSTGPVTTRKHGITVKV